MQHEVIQRALFEGVSADADSDTIAVATVRALQMLFGVLRPLVGELALHALYLRSLHLARSSFQRPTEIGSQPDSDWFAPLHADLNSRSPAEARRASHALLLSLVDLLISLIGDPLTDRMLRRAWGGLAAEPALKEKP